MQEDFHYYATYCAAFLAGYTPEESREIAYSAQLVDCCSKTFIRKFKGPVTVATTQLQTELADTHTNIPGIQDITRIWASFHFLPGNLYAVLKRRPRVYMDKYRLICDVNGPLVRDTVILANKGGTEACGIAMHILADTWAHRYFAGTPSFVINDAREFFELRETENGIELTLRGVRYPSRVVVEMERQDEEEAARRRNYRTILYDLNDGISAPFEQTYSILLHPRPNTDQGASLRRDGYTLTGWNTAPDGSGESVGLGSRVTVPKEGLRLFAQWERWTAPERFQWESTEDGAVITGYAGAEETLVIPADVDGVPVTSIASGAFRGCRAAKVIFPSSLQTIANGAFSDAALREMTLFDNIETISDAAFQGCGELQTLHINAAEDPYGCQYRRESVFADKADLLIAAAGQKKMVFYGGCNVWYNLIGAEAAKRFPDYRVINMGLNGTVNSLLQMEIIAQLMEPGDIFFHAPEISSPEQLLLNTRMDAGDDMLWAGLEYNYNLVAYADLRQLPGALDSWQHYLQLKKPGGSYADAYRDASGNAYLDATGSIPLIRTQGMKRLTDSVTLNPDVFSDGLINLSCQYRQLTEKGVRVYVSWACLDTDALTEEEAKMIPEMNERFHRAVAAMDGPTMISDLQNYLFESRDFYDTHYHLLTPQAYRNTDQWLNDLEKQMLADGL